MTTEIERELIKATRTTMKGKRQDALQQLVDAAADLPTDVWEELSTGAQKWVNEGTKAMNAEKNVKDFSDDEEDDEEPNAPEDEDENDEEGEEGEDGEDEEPAEEDDEGEGDEEPEEEEEPVKAKRGRPPGAKKKVAAKDEDDEDGEPKKKRGPGRPPKDKAESTKPKRGPGRPRKDEEEEEDDEKPKKKAVKKETAPKTKKHYREEEEEEAKPAPKRSPAPSLRTGILNRSDVKYRLKLEMIKDPNSSVEYLFELLGKEATKMTITQIRAEFRHTLRFLKQEGILKSTIDE